MARRSRFPAPGTLADAWWESHDGDRYHDCRGEVVVLATSRHSKTITLDEAVKLLESEYGEGVGIQRVGFWKSVTQRDYDNNDQIGDAADVGGWSEGATGSAWVQVAYPTVAHVLARMAT